MSSKSDYLYQKLIAKLDVSDYHSAGAGGDADGIEISDSCLPVYTEYQYSILISQSYKQDIVTSFSEGTSLCSNFEVTFYTKMNFP